MHKAICCIEIITNPRINNIREVIVTSSKEVKPWDIFTIEEMLHSCFCTEFHAESLKDGTLLICTPTGNLETEDALDSIALLKTIQDQVVKILPRTDVEVCLTFIHATPKELMRYKTENVLQKYAHQIHVKETELQRMLKNTVTPLDEVHLIGLENDLTLLKREASEASVLLAAL